MYDRRQKKRIQQKWARAVEHIAQEPLDPQQLPRRLTVFISAPPADGLVAARDNFQEYVKPILVAAALDWDAIEGRREGDVRAGIAEKIRKLRQKRGEQSAEPMEEGVEELLEAQRQRSGIKEWSGPLGDIVIGRHTWKEYVRGLHEGWLGPLDAPGVETPETKAVPSPPTIEATPETSGSGTDSSSPASTDDASPTAVIETPKPEEPEKPKEDESKPKKKKQPPPFIMTAEYDNATLSRSCPQALGPVAVIPQQHLLGFFNFPIRIYRFLNKRKVADQIGRETAAAVLGAYRPFEAPTEGAGVSEDGHSGAQSEQNRLLAHEEPDWHKTATKRDDDDKKERVWLDDMVLDPRIAERMRRFVLDAEVEERAKSAPSNEEKSWFRSLWPQEKKKGAWEGLSED